MVSSFLRRIPILIATQAMVSGCDGLGTTDAGPPPEPRVFVDNSQWTLVYPGPDQGPFTSEGAYFCTPNGRIYEEPVFEVNTDVCNDTSYTQLTTDALNAGELVHFTLWHLALAAPEPAEGHIEIAIGDSVVWTFSVDIPSDEAVYHPFFEVPADAPAGTPVYLHVQNHGANSYKFLEFTTGPAEAFDDYPGDG